MNGTDHHEPQAGVPHLAANVEIDADRLEISTLPAYFSALEEEIAERHLQLPQVHGELRDPKRHHLLAGVLSSRVRIKRRNDQCETTLLEFAEPLSALPQSLGHKSSDHSVWTGHLTAPPVRRPMDLLQEAWRLLLLCQPHDSICGCSVEKATA